VIGYEPSSGCPLEEVLDDGAATDVGILHCVQDDDLKPTSAKLSMAVFDNFSPGF
jgi:hypothetical protein